MERHPIFMDERCYIVNIAILPTLIYRFNAISIKISNVFFKKILFIYFRERGREGEREGEKHQCVVASHMPRTGDLAYNPGMCPDWESTWRTFGLQAGAQSTEPHQPGPLAEFLNWVVCLPGVESCGLFIYFGD